MNQINLLSIIICGLFLSMNIHGKEPKKKDYISQPTLQTQLMDQQVSALMADKVNINTNVIVEGLAEVEYLSKDELSESEALRFPADELYGSNWDTCWVNPFRSKEKEVDFPDSFYVDCRSFYTPIDGNIKITSKYGPRRRRMHRGIDLKVQVGDTIRSAFSGKVRIKGYERRGYGYYLVVRHPNGLETIYGHLSKFLVSENDIVKTGQAIALGGNTGRSTGAHLHFETRFLGQALNPSDIIDFTEGVPHEDFYAIYKNKAGRTNVYTSTSERIVYHRVKRGETLGQIALKYGTSVTELCRLNGLSRKSTLRIGQSIRCGTTSARPAKKETIVAGAGMTESTSQNGGLYHKVQARESLSSIANRYGTTVDALCRLNNIQSTAPLSLGQEICYKAAPKSTAKEGDEENKLSRTTEEKVSVLTQEDQTKTVAASESRHSVYHRVVRGETLGKIAHQYGTSVDELCRLNGISKTTTLRLGQKLRYEADQQTIVSSSSELSQSKSVQPVYYQVKKGDTLGVIARKHGVSINKLCEMNNITTTTILKIGRSLRCS